MPLQRNRNRNGETPSRFARLGSCPTNPDLCLAGVGVAATRRTGRPGSVAVLRCRPSGRAMDRTPSAGSATTGSTRTGCAGPFMAPASTPCSRSRPVSEVARPATPLVVTVSAARSSVISDGYRGNTTVKATPLDPSRPASVKVASAPCPSSSVIGVGTTRGDP